MAMDRCLSGFYRSMNGIRFSEESFSVLPSQDLTHGVRSQEKFLNQTKINVQKISPHPSGSNLPSGSCVGMQEDSQEDCDFSDVALKYIDQMLMEEEVEEKTCMFRESLALEATEKLFYDIIGQNYPPLVDHHRTTSILENCCDHYANPGNFSTYNSAGNLVQPGRNCNLGGFKPSNIAFQSTSQSSFGSSSDASNAVDSFMNVPMSTHGVPNTYNGSDSVLQFMRGFEEASKFLPNGNGLFNNLANHNIGLLAPEVKAGAYDVVDKVVKKHEDEYFTDASKGKKNYPSWDLESEEERSNKQTAISDEMTVTSEMFDRVLLCDADKDEATLRESLQNEASKTVQKDGQSKGSRKSYGRKKCCKKDLVDLRSLLTLCAQAVAADDQKGASKQLKEIRRHASPMGDGMQRMAYYFANAFEARLAGSGSEMYKAVITKPSAANFLKVYHLLLSVTPFMKVSNFLLNKTIVKAAEKAERLHVIDFGVFYGFSWPSLIQGLSSRPGGPPKLRITGIDFPQPGFRPAERVEETQHRLVNYAKSFNVPFEFNALAQKFETIQIEDLKICDEEVIVVRCRYTFRNLLDETVVAESPRNIVLNLIRKMNPDIFMHAIVNGAYDAPFFLTRFREALFHFSSLFDMLEDNVPRKNLERMVIEREIFGREIMNVIACEGSERIERPETYKQWQLRNERAGFRQLSFDKEIVELAKERVKSCYHKDFLIDEDGQWLRLGWKGRILYAISSWKPAC